MIGVVEVSSVCHLSWHPLMAASLRRNVASVTSTKENSEITHHPRNRVIFSEFGGYPTGEDWQGNHRDKGECDNDRYAGYHLGQGLRRRRRRRETHF